MKKILIVLRFLLSTVNLSRNVIAHSFFSLLDIALIKLFLINTDVMKHCRIINC